MASKRLPPETITNPKELLLLAKFRDLTSEQKTSIRDRIKRFFLMKSQDNGSGSIALAQTKLLSEISAILILGKKPIDPPPK